MNGGKSNIFYKGYRLLFDLIKQKYNKCIVLAVRKKVGL
jgi:hypothetical protein